MGTHRAYSWQRQAMSTGPIVTAGSVHSIVSRSNFDAFLMIVHYRDEVLGGEVCLPIVLSAMCCSHVMAHKT